MTASSGLRTPVCYLAPWVDFGGSDKGTIDWFRWLDRDRFEPILITTQPSENRRISEVYPYAAEVWELPDFLAGQHFPAFIFDVLHTRGVEVLHIMNSRLGFDLLPDLACLPEPPAVVVQLHVEEPDKSGYVRYVTTRYGNLVDAFSVSSHHLAHAVQGYDVPRSKIEVIPTGVDAEREFNPRVARDLDLATGRPTVLYAGRLTEQKDPLLMVEVVRRLAGVVPEVLVDVVGEGPLEAEVARRVASAGLEANFRFHPPTDDLAPWYAASTAMLMTSVFEGVPYAVYEAMAMELPVVAPALPGNVELMNGLGGDLVEDRTDAAAYAQALARILQDADHREALGAGARSHVREHLSVQQMARGHERLYRSLLERRPRRGDRARRRPGSADAGDRLRFRSRPRAGRPLVSVVMPCYNHGQFLGTAVESVLAQRYPAVELIIVDDGSSDPDTIRALDAAGEHDGVTVFRLQRNSGPSAARNLAIERSRGRYILPVDADNLLLPDAIAELVDQLQSAGERVGFIYPNCQYFGTRDDYFEPPAYNLALLLAGNYCDTCSLIDREVFDAGFRYAADIVHGHEDWDFVLALASRGVIGEPARAQTLLYRKHGFTRSDAVEHARDPFHEEIQRRNPELFGCGDDVGKFGCWSGPRAETKAVWAPSLSVVSTQSWDLDSVEGRHLLGALRAQTCLDFELIIECSPSPRELDLGRIRRIPPGLCTSGLQRFQEGLGLARGAHLLLAEDVLALLIDRTFVERLYRTLWAAPKLDAIVFADARSAALPALRLLDCGEAPPRAHALAWRRARAQRFPREVLLDEGEAAESLARFMSVWGSSIEWRHCQRASADTGSGGERWLQVGRRDRASDPHVRSERAQIAELPGAVPSLRGDEVRRWLGEVSWIPPATQIISRQREKQGERRIVVPGRADRPGFALEHDIGAIQQFAPPGTVRLVHDEGGYRTVPRGSPRPDGVTELGHLETAPLPLFHTVQRAVLDDGSETLVSGEHDGLSARAVELEFLGYAEAFPNDPRVAEVDPPRHHGLVGLLRYVDLGSRRHLYATALGRDGELIGELGALHVTGTSESLALYLNSDGSVETDQLRPEQAWPGRRQAARWAAAPLGWHQFGHRQGRLRAVARRAIDAVGGAPRPAARRRASRLGYLYRNPGEARVELFSAVHPITGDQLLTRYALEAADMGYGRAVSVGWLIDEVPVSGARELRRVSVPWASRFGLQVRRTA